MKTLDETIQEVKDLIKDWDWKEEDIEKLFNSPCVMTLVEETAHRFAQSVAQQALDNASENAKLCVEDNHVEVDKSSITNPNNIPPHYLVGD